MSENKRPRGRKRGETTASGEVHKKDEALNAKAKAGNVESGSRPQQPSDKKGTGNRGLLEDAINSAIHTQQTQAHNANQTVRPGSTFGSNQQPNQGYNYQQQQQRPQQQYVNTSTRPTRSRGLSPLLKILLFIVLAFLLISCLTSGFGGGSTAVATPTPVPTAAPTPVPTQATTASSSINTTGHFVQPTTTYTDTNSTALNTASVSGVRDKFTQLRGNGNDVATILIYMCGTDLESNYAMATSDLSEMIAAPISDHVNIIVETGGTKRWQNSIISNSTNQRYQVVQGGLVPLNQNVGMRAMTDPNTLYDFVQFGITNYPADRYMLIFWDHGGGSVAGYGYDQNYPNGSMSVDKIAQVLQAVGTKFDVIGFDACLMANTETAMAVAPYADYLLASEETEPGTGWYYTEWVSAISQKPSIPTLQLGQKIIDDFVTVSYQNSPRDQISLSLIDLGEFEAYVPDALTPFSQDITTAINSNNYRAIANARSVTKEFAQSTKIDQVDLVHFCANINSQNAINLANAVQSCVKYNRVANMKNAYGLSIYFPYYAMNKLNSASQIYKNIGMNADYTNAIRSFASLASSGQVVNSYSSNSIYDLLGGGSVSNGQSVTTEDILNLLTSGSMHSTQSSGYSSLYDLLGGVQGVDYDNLDLFSAMLGRDHVNPEGLVFTERDGKHTLALTDDQWALMQNIALNVWVDDGQGYIDLGYDNVYDFDDNGNLVADYDGLWVSINNQAVPYYVTYEEYPSDDTYVVRGYVPTIMHTTDAEGNTFDHRANLLIEFTDEDVNGSVVGAQLVYDDEDVEAKGVMFYAGDKVTFEFVCDYYNYNGEFVDQYKFGEPVTMNVTKDHEINLKVGTFEIVNQPIKYGYVLTDIYNAKHWTPMLDYNK